jgi:hypothetical protein
MAELRRTLSVAAAAAMIVIVIVVIVVVVIAIVVIVIVVIVVVAGIAVAADMAAGRVVVGAGVTLFATGVVVRIARAEIGGAGVDRRANRDGQAGNAGEQECFPSHGPSSHTFVVCLGPRFREDWSGWTVLPRRSPGGWSSCV